MYLYEILSGEKNVFLKQKLQNYVMSLDKNV